MVLERDEQLAALSECLDAARAGQGRLALVAGEAGIGKTTLVQQFSAGVRGARVAIGACDPLDTPTPLGPMLEIADRLGATDVDPSSARSREALFRSFLDELASRRTPTVAVLEDVHWADEATLELIRYTARRLDGVRALLVVTYRDDELGPDHPLRTVVGDLATTPGVQRLTLAALSHEAVATLAASVDRRIDVHALYARSGGNPFFVTEALSASHDQTVPATIRDAVLARAARLSPSARAALDAAAVPPTRAEVWLVTAVAEVDDDALDECVAAGMLQPAGPGMVAFRHELARLAIDAALPPARRATLHGHTAELLLEHHDRTADPPRIAYHAEQAGLTHLAHTYATHAARHAAHLGAHREAAAQYQRSLDHARDLPDADLADLLQAFSREASMTDQHDTALDASLKAVELRRKLGDPRKLGTALRLKASALWNAGRGTAIETIQEAISILETVEPSEDLAEAYAAASHYAMLARDHPSTLAWGEKAIALAEQLQATNALARTLNGIGSSKILNGDPSGIEDLKRSIAVAKAVGLDPLVGIGWSNIGSGSGEVRDYATAEPALHEAIAFTAAHDLDSNNRYSRAWLARVRFERGDWTGAEALIDELPLDESEVTPITKIVALGVLGRLRARRGDADPEALLEQAWRLATETGDLQRLWPIAAARAEAAWLVGDTKAIPELVDDTYRLACERGHAWAIGELGLARRRAGIDEPLPEAAAEPYRLHAAGRYTDAAAAWDTIGCPYDSADALADSSDPDHLLQALAAFDELGADPAAARVRRRLRQLGVKGVPRGSRPATTANPAGLTPRQIDVLALLALGLTDADIASRLHLSTKTVGHHVSAILAKLNATTRAQAAHHARDLGITPPEGG